MKIAKARFVSPDHNFWYGFFAITLSVFVFAYSSRFGQVSILAYYALWFPLILIDYRHSLGNYAKFYWIIAFGVFACLSVFWSAAPSVTMRASLQYMTHIVCALIVARTMNIRTLSMGMLAGVCMVVLYSLAFGGYNYDSMDGNFSFVGAFSSKNQLGFYCSVGIYFAFAAIFILRERGIWRLLALGTLVLAGYALLASQSATSIIATAGTLAVVIGLSLLLLFAPRTRKMFFLVGLIAAIGLAFAAINLGGLDLLLGAFGKDTTLTGRTYLWGEGIAAWRLSPYFGVGYQAYWVQGFSEAERLWEEFYIASRSGFHFHNTYIELLVELGVVGLFLLAVVIVRVPVGHLIRLLDDRDDVASYVVFGMSVMLVVRSFFEVDMMHPYAIGSFLLYYSAGLLATSQSTRRYVAPESQPELQVHPAQ
ncbi:MULTISPECIES: O-antigen ligase [unclassified Mesorhizobium]|jgi:exopolysaccharide production protein ExoQ|uniref:O-antigen ligase family protein n=1 Tax=unclassified Mesorhizobium TaxID=325217 RepID=UPI0008F3B55F|nr:MULTISPECIES: O-antigen ligase [unclassified Mesorhizobium]RJG46400.1 O-antigen ligase family protein [Mesorhizobium sp. DCY119]SFT99740.1 exopolysaccharide production protein ExoQ [Mesorhizobium sp. YR577]